MFLRLAFRLRFVRSMAVFAFSKRTLALVKESWSGLDRSLRNSSLEISPQTSYLTLILCFCMESLSVVVSPWLLASW